MQTGFSRRKGPHLTWRAWLPSAHLCCSLLVSRRGGTKTNHTHGLIWPGTEAGTAYPDAYTHPLPVCCRKLEGFRGEQAGDCAPRGVLRSQAGSGFPEGGSSARVWVRAPGSAAEALARAWGKPSLGKGDRASRRARGQGTRRRASKVRCPACRGSRPSSASARSLSSARVQMQTARVRRTGGCPRPTALRSQRPSHSAQIRVEPEVRRRPRYRQGCPMQLKENKEKRMCTYTPCIKYNICTYSITYLYTNAYLCVNVLTYKRNYIEV